MGRVRVMSVPEIASRLGDRFALLRGGPRDAPARHQTLRAVVDWSWNLLEPAGQRALRALSIFPGGFTATAAEHLLDGSEILEDLVDQSLLKIIDTPAGARFGMLETVREFSAARREEAGETDRVTDAFLSWARDFGLAHHQSLYSTDPFGPVARIRAEQDNVVQALRIALARADGPTVAATAAVLGGLWIIESNFTRLGWLTDETGYLLSHFRPGPEHIEATRAALGPAAAFQFFVRGPRATRSLVALRKLPTTPGPSTIGQATAIVLTAAVEDRAGLHRCCESDDPMVAGVASAIAGYIWENEGDLDNAMKAAEQMLEAFEGIGIPWLQAQAHARISELCLQVERADEVLRHLDAALPVYEGLGAWSDVAGIRLWMVLANLQRGALDEAERWLEQAPEADGVVTATYGLGVRAEIMLARGEVEAGLRLWRRTADTLANAPEAAMRGMEPWHLEVQAITVVAHARHGRLELVKEIPDALRPTLAGLLTQPTTYLLGFPVAGALLLALAMVDIDRGERATGARMVALAERFRFLRGFQPTMSAAHARESGQHADRSAYDEAVSTYADLGQDDLRAVALALLRERG